MPPNILIIEDDDHVADLLMLTLERQGFLPQRQADGLGGLHAAQALLPDLIVLDLMLPGLDGFEVCRRLRQAGTATEGIPILMLTAKGEEIDRVLGLELGADDYLTKPFSPRELVARIKAILRRTQRPQLEPELLQFADLTIDLSGRSLKTTTGSPSLTPKEFDLLVYLAQHPGRAFTREQLLQGVWGYDYYGDSRTVDEHMRRLRQKLQGAGRYLKTVWGVGYKFEVEP